MWPICLTLDTCGHFSWWDLLLTRNCPAWEIDSFWLEGVYHQGNHSCSYTCSNTPVSVNPAHGQPRGFWQLSDIPPRGSWQWCSDTGAVLTFKIKIFPHPGVENRGDSDTEVQMRMGTLTEEIFKCYNLLGPASLISVGEVLTLYHTLYIYTIGLYDRKSMRYMIYTTLYD